MCVNKTNSQVTTLTSFLFHVFLFIMKTKPNCTNSFKVFLLLFLKTRLASVEQLVKQWTNDPKLKEFNPFAPSTGRISQKKDALKLKN